MSWQGMVRIHGTPNLMEAHIFRTALAQYGIEARVRNEMLSTLAGAVPVTEVMVEVWVAEEDAEKAVAIIQEALSRPAEPDDDADGRLSLAMDSGAVALAPEASDVKAKPVCPSCRETSPPGFEVCWKCGSDLAPPSS